MSIKKSPHSDEIPFDPGATNLTETTSGEAIRELYFLTGDSSKGYTFAQYGGNAISGRFLEFFSGINSDDAPLYSPTAIDVTTIVAATTSTSATCTIEFLNIEPVTPVVLYTLTFTAEKRVDISGSPLFTLPIDGELAVKVGSGSIVKPHLYFIVKGSI